MKRDHWLFEIRIVDYGSRTLKKVHEEYTYWNACLMADVIRNAWGCDAVVRVPETGAMPYDSRKFSRRERWYLTEEAEDEAASGACECPPVLPMEAPLPASPAP